MDIKIEAPGHKNQKLVRSHYNRLLAKKYGKYDFVKSIDVNISMQDGRLVGVSLQLRPEKGTMLYASGKSKRENIALNSAIRRMNVQIEKYKQKRYHTVHRIRKLNIDS